MYKGRSQSQQRGMHYRDSEPLGPVIEKSVLSAAEMAHFAIGTDRHQAWLNLIDPFIRTFAINGFRKPKDISRLLNKQRVRTAAGQQWTPRLAWFLLGFLYSDERKKQRTRKPANLRPPQHVDIAKRPLTADERARRVAALRSHFQKKG